MNLIRAERDQLFEYGPFTIRRQRPGEAFGPLAVIDHMSLKAGAHIPLHTHQDDEIFSYVWRGSAQIQDDTGEKVMLNAKRAMVVNAGEGIRHEESTPLIESEMLQAYIRPEQAGGEGRVQTFFRPEGATVNGWTRLAGPADHAAPLTLRQKVYIYDLKLERGKQLDVPHQPGFSTWLTVLEGIVQIGDWRLHKGDAVNDTNALPAITGERDALAIAFLVQDQATAVLSGTVSGSQ